MNRIVEEAIKLKIKFLTLFTFSKDNWARPKKEVTMLMDLFVSTIKNNNRNFFKNEIKIKLLEILKIYLKMSKYTQGDCRKDKK